MDAARVFLMVDQIKATDLFSNWAKEGKDQRMANTHAPSVQEMLDHVLTAISSPFSFIDAGCGNGWVVRKVLENDLCKYAVGVDGASTMIEQAKLNGPKENYVCEDLLSWIPDQKVDIVHSMEVLYYFKEPLKLLNHIFKNWLKPNGKLVSGVDFYFENEKSHSWPADLNVHMTLLSKEEWLSLFQSAGFLDCHSWYANGSSDFHGTLCLFGHKHS